MALYINSAGEYIYTYRVGSTQYNDNVDGLVRYPYYVKKNGFYYLDGLRMYRYYNRESVLYAESDSFDGIVKFYVLNSETNVLLSTKNFFIQHNGSIRFSGDLFEDFDIYPCNVIRNSNTLFNVYDFSNVVFGTIPEQCSYYQQYDNKHYLDKHCYFDSKFVKYDGCYVIDTDLLFDKIVKCFGLYYAVNDQYRTFCVDYDFSDRSIREVGVSKMQVLITTDVTQFVYYFGELYEIPTGSTIP